MDAWWFVSTDLAGNYFDLSCGERKERRYCQDFSLSPVTTQHLLHGCMLRHETAPSFKRITSLPPSAAVYLEEAILTLNRKPSKSTAILMSTRDLETNGIVINHRYFLAEPLGSNIGRNLTLYHMTGPFPPLEYWFKAACSNQKTAKQFYHLRDEVQSKRPSVDKKMTRRLEYLRKNLKRFFHYVKRDMSPKKKHPHVIPNPFHLIFSWSTKGDI